ncbi:MAG: LPS-assembly protein LptD [Oceanococcaceae bacterium]
MLGKSAAVYAIAFSLAGLSQATHAQECPTALGGWIVPADTQADPALHLEAGRADIDAYGLSRLEDGVELRYQGRQLRSEALEYDQPNRSARSSGAVEYEDAGTRIGAAAAELNLEADEVDFRAPRFSLNTGGQGSAERLRLSPSGLDLRGVEYTTCSGDRPAWAIRGSRIQIDAERGQGTARNMQLRFFGVPLLYLPWFRFPAGLQRQSGLLFPELGNSDSTGAYIRWPLYLNLHPQADLTLTPEWLQDRGAVLGGKARALWPAGRGQVSGRWLEEDEQSGRQRGQIDAFVSSRLLGGTRAELRYAEVSDIDFLRELGLESRDAATNALERSLELSWRPQRDLRTRVRVVDFQILDPSIDSTVYARTPELSVDYRPLNNWYGLRPLVGLEMVRFTADGENSTQRFDISSGLEWALARRGWETSLGATWRGTRYREAGGRVLERDLPTYRAGFGLLLQRRTDNGLLHSLRPRLDYLYTPYTDQSDLPVFDTSLPDFSLDQLRSGNRFSGIDRISDENTLVPSLESSWIDPSSGIRRARLRLGLQLRFADSRVTLPDTPSSEAGSSDWLVEFDLESRRGIRGRAAGQYNTRESRFDALSLGGRYLGDRGQRLQLGYRFRRDLFEQIEAVTIWPLGGRWTGAARWNWALDASRSLETLAGVSYQSCCWGVTAGLRQFVNSSAEDLDTGIFLQLAFRGLGDFGSGFGDLFRRDTLSY